MAKAVHDDVLDAALNYIKNNCAKITVCSAQPTTYAEGNADFALADVAVDSSDFTNANGDTSGRKLTIGAQLTVPVDANGTATHIALLDTANSKLLYVTTCSSQVLTSGNEVNLPAWDIEIADPS